MILMILACTWIGWLCGYSLLGLAVGVLWWFAEVAFRWWDV